MKVLLDTNIVLWATVEPERLPEHVTRLLSSSEAQNVLSVVTPWELAIKKNTGKWSSDISVEAVIREQERALRLSDLPVRRIHALRTLDLPPIHRDPFDRMLIAQALVEKMPVVTSDDRFAAYGVEVIW